MKKIDTTSWKEFRVGDLFDIHPTKAYKLTNVQLFDGGRTPVVVNSAYNNGIGGYSTLDATEKGNMITFSDTVDANTIFYQKEDFVGYPHVQGMYPTGMFKDKWRPYSLMFFASLFRKTAVSKGFDYGNKFRRDIAIDIKLKLPAKNDAPDWQYMEDYIRSLEQKTESTILTLMATKFSQLNIDTTYWKEFTLYSNDLFDIDMGTKLDRAKMTKSNPKINFVGRGSVHNGVVDIVDEISGIEPYQAGYITISLGGSIGASFVQDKPFYTSQNVCVLKPKHNMSYYSKEFIVTMIKNEGQRRYKAFSDELNRHIRTDFTILLPATPSGDPDWHYMEMYMRGVEAIVKNKLSLLVPHKQELALKDAANVTFNNANVTYIDQSRTYNVK